MKFNTKTSRLGALPFCFLFLLMGFMVTALSTTQALRIEIRQGTVKKTPFAVVAMLGETTFDKKIKKIVDSNLNRSGLFQSIHNKAFIQTVPALREQVRYEDWRVIKAQFLITIQVSRSIFGNLDVTCNLHDVMRGQKILSETISGDTNNWRQLAHIVSDKIFQRITGEDGFFSARLAYVQESGKRGKTRRYRLAVMDSDGYNNQYLTGADEMCMMPRYSPDGKKLTYVKFVNHKAQVFLVDLESGRKSILGRFNGISFSSRFSPDSTQVVMSVYDNKGSYIALMDVDSGNIRKLTPEINDRIDVSPCFTPDGKYIYFTSNRYGQENIFSMDTNGNNIQHISIKGGKYSQPVVSPRGDKIAFSKQIGNRFSIGVMNLDGTNEYMVSNGHMLEEPAWTPNGRYITYTTQERGRNGKTHLMIIDLTGRNLIKMPTMGEASGCSWSPPADAKK